MQVAAKSAALHQLQNILCEPCNWNSLPLGFSAEVILLSDINYDPAVFKALEKVLKRLMDNGCTLLLATPQRLMAKPFIERLLRYVVSQTIEEVDEKGAITSINIFILKINA